MELNDQQRQELYEKLEDQKRRNAYAGIAGGLGNTAASKLMRSPGEVEDEYYKGIERRRSLDQGKLEDDAGSMQSQLAQALASKMMPGRDFSKMSATQLKSALPYLEKMYSVEQQRIYRQDDLKSKKADKDERDEEKRQDKLNRQQEQDMQKLSKDVAGTQALTNAIDEIEAELDFNLDEAEAKAGKVKVKGKEMDLPGVSIPGIGRVTAYSEKSRNLQSAADRVFNATLKDRSGAAVTNPELERLRREFNDGKFNTEAEIVSALQRYKRGVVTELKNREAAYNPEVVETYTDQGGRTSRTIKASPSNIDDEEKKSLERQKRIQELKAKQGQ